MKKLFPFRIFAAFVIISMLAMTFGVFSVHAVSTRIYLAPSNNIYTTDTASVGTKFNVTVWTENAPNVGGAQVYLEFNDTVINVTRWFEPKNDPQYIFYGKGTSALPTPPNDAAYQHLGLNRGKVLVSVSLFPPAPPYFTGSGKICIFEFKITKVPTTGNYTSGLIINTSDTYMLDGDTGSEIAGVVKENGSYKISKIGAPPKKFTLTITATQGGTTNPSIGTHQYTEGDMVSVNATANSGFSFDHWMLDNVNSGSANPFKVTMNANHTLEAFFVAITPTKFQLTISVNGNGTTTPIPGTYMYDAGTTVNVTAIPDSGWLLQQWILDGQNKGVSNPFSLTMNANHTLTAEFKVRGPVIPEYWLGPILGIVGCFAALALFKLSKRKPSKFVAIAQ
jgi:hypothetical protein